MPGLSDVMVGQLLRQKTTEDFEDRSLRRLRAVTVSGSVYEADIDDAELMDVPFKPNNTVYRARHVTCVTIRGEVVDWAWGIGYCAANHSLLVFSNGRQFKRSSSLREITVS